jgi:hypothetical protein
MGGTVGIRRIGKKHQGCSGCENQAGPFHRIYPFLLFV